VVLSVPLFQAQLLSLAYSQAWQGSHYQAVCNAAFVNGAAAAAAAAAVLHLPKYLPITTACAAATAVHGVEQLLPAVPGSSEIPRDPT
jgi:hypothetical protein